MNEVEIFKQSLDVSRIIMVITILMTIVSVVFSALNLAFQRSHNRKSVKPLCNIVTSMDKNSLKIIIENSGLGPMIVHGVTIIDNDSTSMGIHEYFENRWPIEEVALFSQKKQTIISTNDKRIIYEAKLSDNGNSVAITDFMAKLKDVEIAVNYCDIYDKKYSAREHF